MTIVCPRCGSPNSRWEKRCISCRLPFDAALRAAHTPAQIAAAGDASVLTSADAAHAAAQHAAHKSLADLLGIEVEHVRALADNGIHTLEHIAESLPHQIAHALSAWTHIDPGALIARAQQLLHINDPIPERQREPERKKAPPPQDIEPVEWWKMT